MTTNRRDFLKFVVAGSVAAGCPVDMSLLAADGSASAPPIVDGEHNEICHQVRDGHVFAKPAVSARYDVVIVGGGMSGLAAAYHLKAYNYLLLEKEDHWGGNAYEEDFHGQYFATGSAFDTEGSEADQLAKALGLKQLPIDSPDPTIVRGKLVANTWLSGLDDLPYDPSVRESFKKFRSDVQKMKVEENQAHLDAQPFSQYLTGYAPELKQWWDCYGPSNWGAKSDETSAFVGLNELQVIAHEKEVERRITLPGGNGAITKKLAETVQRDHPSAMLGGATVVSVAPEQVWRAGDLRAPGRTQDRGCARGDHGLAEIHHRSNRLGNSGRADRGHAANSLHPLRGGEFDFRPPDFQPRLRHLGPGPVLHRFRGRRLDGAESARLPSRNTTFSRATRRWNLTSARSSCAKRLAAPLPRTFWPISRNYFQGSTPIRSKCICTAAGIRCTWPNPDSSPRCGRWRAARWKTSTSPIPIRSRRYPISAGPRKRDARERNGSRR